MARLAGWYRLAGGGYAAVDLVVASTRDTLAAVAGAQERGRAVVVAAVRALLRD